MTALLAALFIALIVGLLAFGMHQQAKRREVWAQIAERLGLEVRGKDDIGGDLEGSSVRADIYSTGSGKNRRSYTRVRVARDLPEGISLAPENFLSRLAEDISTGDPDFDHAVRIKGNEGMALALLDRATRERVRAALASGWTYADAEWTYTSPKLLNEPLEAVIHEGVALAAFLRDAATKMVSRLVERVRDEDLASARRRCLQYLIDRYAGTGAVGKALAIAREDRDASVRLVAARELGDAAVLAGIVRARGEDEALRAKALDAAAELAGAPEVVAAVAALVDERVAAGTAGLDKVLELALVRALAVVVHPGAEALLIGALGSADAEVQFAAIRALGRVGTVAAVQHLTPIRDRFMAFARESSSLAKQAILEIQARAGGAEAGALALAGGGEAGALALSEADKVVGEEA